MWGGDKCICLAVANVSGDNPLSHLQVELGWQRKVCIPVPWTDRAPFTRTHSNALRQPEQLNQSWPHSENAFSAWKGTLLPLGGSGDELGRTVEQLEQLAGHPLLPPPWQRGLPQGAWTPLFPPHSPDQHKGTGSTSSGRKYSFYLSTGKPWVALYESKITIFSIYASWYNEGENQPPNANDTMPP